MCPASRFLLGSVKLLGGFFVPVGFSEVSVVPMGVEFGGDAEAERGSVGVVGFDDAVDVFGGREQLQRCADPFVELVAVEPNVDVGHN